jgi:hypothetical protein
MLDIMVPSDQSAESVGVHQHSQGNIAHQPLDAFDTGGGQGDEIGRCMVPSPGVINSSSPGSWTSSRCQMPQTPPDLVVKTQPVDIVDVILWLVLRLRVVYQREIKG